jgi:cellulose synthase/poly-beta-1,6-N-acetylglucosamine synthase-like glycosyltransferase
VEAFDAVIIIDADTIVDPGFGSALAAAGPVGEQAFQAYFDVRNPADSPLTQMATVLAAANYRFAYALKRRVGLNAPLLGNGMCLGTAVLAAHGWKAFTIAEDWELYTFYTTQGVPIESLETAHLYSQEARSFRQSATQRQRWTAGKLTVLARLAGRLLRSREIGPAQKLDAAAELTSLGPVVHLGLVIGVGVLTAVLRPPGADWLLMALVASVARLAIYTIAGLTVQPNPLRSVVAFAFLPFYLMWRVWMAAASVKMLGDKPWVRTARE